MKYKIITTIVVLFFTFLSLSIAVNAYTYDRGDSLFDGNFTGSPFLFGVFRSNNTVIPITDSNFTDMNISNINGSDVQSSSVKIINNTFILYPSTSEPSTSKFTYYPIKNYNLYYFTFNFNTDKLSYPFRLFN